jgi:hypothetical protein
LKVVYIKIISYYFFGDTPTGIFRSVRKIRFYYRKIKIEFIITVTLWLLVLFSLDGGVLAGSVPFADEFESLLVANVLVVA